MRKDLLINDTSLNSMGIYVSSDTYLNSPLMDYSEFKVPGRDGTLLLDNKRLNNVMRKFDCYIPETQDVDTALESLKQLIYFNRGYVKLVSDYDPNVYQYGYFARELNVDPFITKTATFSLYFSCLPRQYMTEDGGQISKQINLCAAGIVPNNDPSLISLLANAENDYPYSPAGWMIHTDSLRMLTPSDKARTFNFSATTTGIDKYIVVLHYYKGSDTTSYFKIVKEVDSPNATFDYVCSEPSDEVYQNFFIACPLPFNDISIEVRDTSNNYVYCNFNLTYQTIESSYLSNSHAFGANPLICFRRRVTTQTSSEYKATVDVIYLNGNIYTVDLVSLLDRYGRDYILNNLTYTDGSYTYLSYVVDFANAKAYIVPSFDVNGSSILDISSYLYASAVDIYGSEIETKLYIFGEFLFAAGSLALDGNYFIGRLDNLDAKMGWWKL